MEYVNVILPFALPGYFTYSVPNELVSEMQIGKRAIVQFGKRKYYSALIVETNVTPKANYDFKEIEDIIDKIPIVNQLQIDLWNWIADYYICSLGEVFKAAIPSLLKLESNSKIIYNSDFDFNGELSDSEKELLNYISERKELYLKDIQKDNPVRNLMKNINSLKENDIVFFDEIVVETYKPKYKEYLKLNSLFADEQCVNELFDVQLKRANKQKETLLNFLEAINYKFDYKLDKKEFASDENVNLIHINNLIKKDILIIEKEEISRLDNEFLNNKTEKLNNLSDFQQDTYKQIQFEFNKNNVVLLNGVTSSGKTEIYFHLIKEYLKAGKQILYLVPEIALTTQLISRLKKYFGSIVGIYHSKYNDNIRYEVWKNLCNKDKSSYKIIIGTRSAVFLPFSDLGLIIVDEEHDSSYKQNDPAPRYNARDISVIFSHLNNVKVILGTATPSFESYFNYKIGKYSYVKLDKRYLDIKLPEIHIEDTKIAFKRKQMNSHYSDYLLNQIAKILNIGEQVILFQNRRGFSSYIECDSCSIIPKCKYCDVSLTYHLNSKKLICHYCGFSVNSYSKCNVCNSGLMKTRGFGTEKIENELQTYFPKAKIHRLDLDSARTRKQFENIFEKFENKEIDILVGTQMVTKGLDFDNVGLVGVLNADNMLNFPDFRAYEKSFQILTQVSGRAGRKKSQGKVIIQTSDSENQIIKYVKRNAFEQMFDSLIAERKHFNYPPFSRLINITIKNRDLAVLNKSSNQLAEKLKQGFGKRVTGPNLPLISKIQNLHLKTILIKFDKKNIPKNYKSVILENIENIKAIYKLHSSLISIDVDPM